MVPVKKTHATIQKVKKTVIANKAKHERPVKNGIQSFPKDLQDLYSMDSQNIQEPELVIKTKPDEGIAQQQD